MRAHNGPLAPLSGARDSATLPIQRRAPPLTRLAADLPARRGRLRQELAGGVETRRAPYLLLSRPLCGLRGRRELSGLRELYLEVGEEAPALLRVRYLLQLREGLGEFIVCLYVVKNICALPLSRATTAAARAISVSPVRDAIRAAVSSSPGSLSARARTASV